MPPPTKLIYLLMRERCKSKLLNTIYYFELLHYFPETPLTLVDITRTNVMKKQTIPFQFSIDFVIGQIV